MKEIWKDIKGYEGLYQVSNFGNIKSLARKNTFYCVLRKEYLERPVKERILKTNDKNAKYKQVHLLKNGVVKVYLVHRLVAQEFIPNPNDLPQVNHIDGNKYNNRIDNLEWCTASENNKHAFRIGLKEIYNKTKVNQYDLNGNFIKTWNCITEFYKEKGVSIKSSTISMCCKGKRKTAYGYKWKYADELQ